MAGNYIIAELVSEHELRQAAGEGRPLSSLTAAEKAARVAASVERGDADLRQSLYTPAPGESDEADAAPNLAQIQRFARRPLNEKVAAAEPGVSPAQAIRNARD